MNRRSKGKEPCGPSTSTKAQKQTTSPNPPSIGYGTQDGPENTKSGKRVGTMPSTTSNPMASGQGSGPVSRNEPQNELSPHIAGTVAALDPRLGASNPNALSDVPYSSADYKLLEERLNQKLQRMQQSIQQSIQQAIQASEDRLYKRMVEYMNWKEEQARGHLNSIREDLAPGVSHEEGAPPAPSTQDGSFDGSQQLGENHNQEVYTPAKGVAPVRRIQRTQLRGTAPPGTWPPGMPRAETFGPGPREGYVPNAVNRTMSMQEFPGTYRSFNGVDSMTGTPLGGPSQLTSPASAKKRVFKSTPSSLGMPGQGLLTNQYSEIPKYKLSRAIKTAQELWQEWTVGFQGGPSVKQLEETYKSSWRNGMAERQFFSRRKVVIDEIIRRGEELYKEAVKKADTVHQDPTALYDDCMVRAAEDVDRERGRLSLNALSGKLRKQRNAEAAHAGNAAVYSQDVDGHDNEEDAEGDDNDEDATQLDTQYTETQQATQTQHDHDMMDTSLDQETQRQPQQSQNQSTHSHGQHQQAPVAPMSAASDLSNLARDVINIPHQNGSNATSSGSQSNDTRTETNNTGNGSENGLNEHYSAFERFVEEVGEQAVTAGLGMGEVHSEGHVGKKRRVE